MPETPQDDKPIFPRSEDVLRASETQPDAPSTDREQRLLTVVQQRQAGLQVIMENVINPHNLAAIARSCDAFGVQRLTFTLADPDDRDLLALGDISSASAVKWLDYQQDERGSQQLLTDLSAAGWTLVATVAAADAVNLHDVDFTRYEKLALLVGNEKDGLSTSAQATADLRLTIPMYGMIGSFNVSVATAVLLYEITRQRRADTRDWHLSLADADALYQRWRHRDRTRRPRR